MSKEEITQKLAKEMQDSREVAIFAELIKDNQICFKCNEKEYRLTRLTLGQKQELLRVKASTFGKLSDKPEWKFREQIIIEATKAGHDLIKIDENIIKLQTSIDSLLEQVAQTIDKERLKKQEVKLNTLVYEQELQHQKKSNLLQFSIEDYLEFYVSSYLGYLVTEVKVEEEYVKAFKDYKAFEDSKNYDLIKYIAKYVGYLIRVGELN